MDFDTNFKEYHKLKLENISFENEIFSLDNISSSSSSSKALFQDLHQLDQSFNGLSSFSCLNSEPAFQNGFSDPYDPFSSVSFPDLDDLYERKPFVDHKVMNNDPNIVQNLGCGGDAFNYSNEKRGSDQGFGLSECKEIKALDDFTPDEGSCVTSEKDSFKKTGFKRKIVRQRKQYKNEAKKPNAVKGQWSIDEDRFTKSK